MNNYNTFLHFLRKFIDLSDDEFRRYLLPSLKWRKFEKRELLLKPGEVENYFNFIQHGLIRKYYVKGKEEINTQISLERHIINCEESFHSRMPSQYYIETIEPSTVISISYQDLEEIFDKNKKMEHLGRLVITQSMIVKDRWQMQLLMMTPRERFLHFVTRNPELLQRVPQKYLASFLNIKPETFSRFKHLLRDHTRTVAA